MIQVSRNVRHEGSSGRKSQGLSGPGLTDVGVLRLFKGDRPDTLA